MAMNMQDLCAIQECMIGYKKLVEWLPVQSEEESEMKDNRINVITHISALCDRELTRLSEEYRKEV